MILAISMVVVVMIFGSNCDGGGGSNSPGKYGCGVAGH
jgi:hypothetical protein